MVLNPQKTFKDQAALLQQHSLTNVDIFIYNNNNRAMLLYHSETHFNQIYVHKFSVFKCLVILCKVKNSESKSRRQSDTEAVSQGDVIGRDSLCPGWSLAEHRSCPGLQRPEETSTPLVSAVQGGGTESPGSKVSEREV